MKTSENLLGKNRHKVSDMAPKAKKKTSGEKCFICKKGFPSENRVKHILMKIMACNLNVSVLIARETVS